MTKKKIKYNYNAHYSGDEQKIIYSSCKAHEVPPCPTWIELWGMIIVHMEEVKKAKAIISEEKRLWLLAKKEKLRKAKKL